jgi:AbrB family looped-hinge helix DNA binding protein
LAWYIAKKWRFVVETTLDRFGRVVIPKKVREDLGLEPGVVLKIKKENDKILMEPMHNEPRIVLKKGVLVVTGNATGSIEDAVRTLRKKRISKVGSNIKK